MKLLLVDDERQVSALTQEYLEAKGYDITLRHSGDDMLKGRSVNVYVSKLRQYLAPDSNIEILNVHGEGYQLVVRNAEQ